MKARFLFFLLSALLALEAGASGILTPPASAPGPVRSPLVGHASTLPIEVLGPDQTTESYTLVSAEATKADSLFLQIHGLTYEGKASVRINGGPWVTLNEANVTYPFVTERAFWGIGGPLGTLRLTVPTKKWKLVAGANTVDFRFNDLDHATVGYRVLALNLWSGNTPLIPSDAFTHDDPATWTPPSTNAADIEDGRLAWYASPITEPTLGALNARCTDCHAHDGRDLKYFNYSNRSIIERSVFHGLSRATASNIASFIRSLPIPYEELGRPWNPPYQPGPGLDAKPVRSWAAGAGLGWVLNNDLETLKYIFPNGIDTNALNFRDVTVNAREVPVAIQFPDWNRWLPRRHPLDTYPSYYATNRYVGIYAEITNHLATKTGLAAATYLNGRKSVWDSLPAHGGIRKPAHTDPAFPEWVSRLRDNHHWRVVKMWELMTEPSRQVEEFGHELFGPESDDRRWFHGEVFNVAPHKLGLPRFDGWFVESMQWYQLQLVLNWGNRRNASIVPIDWGYQHALNISSWQNPAKMPTYGIMTLNCVKGGEVMANGLPKTNKAAWTPLRCAPQSFARGKNMKPWFDSIDRPLRRAVAEAFLVAWLRECERFSRDEYEAAGDIRDSARTVIRNMATDYRNLGVSEAIVNRIVDFGARLWPSDNWSRYRP